MRKGLNNCKALFKIYKIIFFVFHIKLQNYNTFQLEVIIVYTNIGSTIYLLTDMRARILQNCYITLNYTFLHFILTKRTYKYYNNAL